MLVLNINLSKLFYLLLILNVSCKATLNDVEKLDIEDQICIYNSMINALSEAPDLINDEEYSIKDNLYILDGHFYKYFMDTSFLLPPKYPLVKLLKLGETEYDTTKKESDYVVHDGPFFRHYRYDSLLHADEALRLIRNKINNQPEAPTNQLNEMKNTTTIHFSDLYLQDDGVMACAEVNNYDDFMKIEMYIFFKCTKVSDHSWDVNIRDFSSLILLDTAIRFDCQ